MKKFNFLVLVAFIVLSLSACSNNNTGKHSVSDNNSSAGDTVNPADNSDSQSETNPSKPEESKDKAVSPADVDAAIAKALGDGYLCTVDVAEDELFLSNMTGIDLSQIESYVAKITAIPSVDLDTLIVMKCKQGYADEAVSILNENYAQNISYIRLYPFNVAKVEGARLYKIDDIVMFIMAGNYAPSDATAEDEAKLAASEYEKIDNAIKSLFGSVPENLAVITEPEDTDNDNGDFSFDDSIGDMPMIGGK